MNKRTKTFLLFILLLSFPLFLWILQQRFFISSHAATSSAVETESGVINGPIETGSDTAASGGKYILFTGQASYQIKDTAYTYPSSAIFVATTGTDTSSCGTQSSPCKTISYAITKASSGATIVIRQGVYREALSFSKTLTIQPYPHEAVWLKGSTVIPSSSFVADGSTWRLDNWTYTFTRDADPNAIDSTDATHPEYRAAGFPDQVFINGSPLTQVDSLSLVTPGRFFVDYNNQKLYIGTDPTNKTVEADTKKVGITINGGNGSIIRGLGITQFGPGYGAAEGGMIRLGFAASTDTITLENNTIVQSGGRGLVAYDGKLILRGNLIAGNDNSGVDTYNTGNMLVEQNIIKENNQAHFDIGWDAAGLKFTNTANAVIRDNTVDEGYLSKGIWADGGCSNAVIVRNNLQHNTTGIKYEISTTAIIASNLLVSNGAGINIGAGSSDSKVYNNTLVKNQTALSIVNSSDSANNTLNTIIKNNLVSNNSGTTDPLLLVEDYAGRLTASQMVAANDYNAYYRTSSTTPKNMIVWCATTTTCTPYTSLSSYQSASSRETHSIGIDNTTDPFFVNEASGDYHLRSNSVVIGKAEPITDTSVIDAINSGISPIISSGQTINIGALQWQE